MSMMAVNDPLRIVGRLFFDFSGSQRRISADFCPCARSIPRNTGAYLSPRRARLRGYAETRPPRCLCWLMGCAFAAAGAAVAAAPACFARSLSEVVRPASRAVRRPCVGLLRAFYHSPRKRSLRGRRERGLRGLRENGENGGNARGGPAWTAGGKGAGPKARLVVRAVCASSCRRPRSWFSALSCGGLPARPDSRQLARATLNRALPCRHQ